MHRLRRPILSVENARCSTPLAWRCSAAIDVRQRTHSASMRVSSRTDSTQPIAAPSRLERRRSPNDAPPKMIWGNLKQRYKPIHTQLIAAIGILVAPRFVHAEERPVFALSYTLGDGTEACPSFTDVKRSLTEGAGYDPVVALAPNTRSVQIELFKDLDGRYVADVRELDASRAFRGDACPDVVSSAVLSLVVSLDRVAVPPNGATQPPPSPAPPQITYVPVIVPFYVDRPVPAMPERALAQKPLEGFVNLGFGAGTGFVPEMSLGPELSLGMRGPAWEVSLGVTYQILMEADSRLTLGEATSAATMQSVLVVGAGCYAPNITPWLSLTACGAVLAGASIVDAINVSIASPGTYPAVFLGPRLGVRVAPVAPVSLRVASELLGNLQRLNVYLTGESEFEFVYRAPPVASRPMAFAELAFP